MSEDFEKGLAIFADVYGPEMAEGCRKGAESGDDFTALHIKFSMELPFGQVWTREDKLSRHFYSFDVAARPKEGAWRALRKALDEEPVGLAMADHVVVNDNLERTVDEMMDIIRQHRPAE